MLADDFERVAPAAGNLPASYAPAAQVDLFALDLFNLEDETL
ncbi:MAG TPA: hypothetical protein P5234_15850 [Thermoanaerobaculaceae bacterium]|nr:hypothetical protein [Thermoanaerobaculaceae bacterium]